MLVWQKGNAAQKPLLETLKDEGFQYQSEGAAKTDEGELTAFTAQNKSKKNELLGLWIKKDKLLMLAWTSLRPQDSESTSIEKKKAEAGRASVRIAQEKSIAPAKQQSLKSDAKKSEDKEETPESISLNVPAEARQINVMKGNLPKFPTFPKLAPKSGTIRGYVYDREGKPLKGAKIGVRSTAVGGFYSGAAATSDASGYYEIPVPWGVAHYYCAGYAVDYGEGRAAMGLHPADGEAEGFASALGTVENWVLLPYGIADRDGIQDNPHYLNNYYGGGIVLCWHSGEDSFSPGSLPSDAEIEVTLIPEGTLLDGSKGRTITLRKKAATPSLNQFYVLNIPAGTYTIHAKIVGGGALKMRETGPYANRSFGLEPKQAMGKATVTFRPGNAKAEMAMAAHGNWDQVCIDLERP